MKKIWLTFAIALFFCARIEAQYTPDITSWVLNNTGAKGYGGIASNVQKVQYSTDSVYVSCTCIPGYSIGPWTGNPNKPKNQNFVFNIPRHPVKNTGTLVTVGLGHTGVWSNGVTVFNAEDANSYNNKGVWHQNAYYFEGKGFDSCLGHPQQQGEYHHHINPKCLYNDKDSLHHSPIIGYAFDGFPIYGAYGYKKATDSTSGLRRMRSGYHLRNIINRDTLPDGTPAGSAGPTVSATYFLGSYVEDYKFTAGYGDLDEHNGRYCVTPEYPKGTYAYFVTIDSALNPIYPYVIGQTYYGVIQSTDDIGPGSGHTTITESTLTYSTGVTEIQPKIVFELTPNPTTDFAYIYFKPESINNIKGGLYDDQGTLLQAYNYMQPSISYAIDLSKYVSGVYFLRLESGKQVINQKIIKAR